MITFADALENWDKVDVTQLTADAMQKNKEAILDLNREQMQHGKKSNGSEITPAYTPFTINEKIKKGQPYGNVTLKDTGSFQDKMELEAKRTKYTITSLDSKTPDLMDKYGEDIFGLTVSGKKEAWLIVRPDVVQAIKNITGAR